MVELPQLLTANIGYVFMLNLSIKPDAKLCWEKLT